VIAMIYLHRVVMGNKIPLTSLNWRSLWITSVITAQKAMDDAPMKTGEFRYIFSGDVIN